MNVIDIIITVAIVVLMGFAVMQSQKARLRNNCSGNCGNCIGNCGKTGRPEKISDEEKQQNE